MYDTELFSINLEQHRQEFPGLSNKVYFNFGGQGTLPRAGLEAIIDAHNYLQQQGPFSVRVNTWFEQKMELLRQDMADELNVAPETIALTENVTLGCNIVLWGIDWQPGDHILLSDCEHPGIIAIVKEVARRFGLEISQCPVGATLNQGDPVTVISQALRPNTRLVVLSHVLWNTGQVLPLAEIADLCHHRAPSSQTVRVLVDAAQSVGCLAVNLADLNVDFYAFTGHKWWCGPAGVGGLYIHPDAFECLQPTLIGWRGIETDNTGQPIGWKEGSKRFEVATSAYPQYEGLRAAIAVHREWGDAEHRYQQIRQMSEYLWTELAKLEGIHCLKTSPPKSGLVSFQVNHHLSPQQMIYILEKQGFFLRNLPDPSCIRACVHYFTLAAEIEQLVEAIRNL